MKVPGLRRLQRLFDSLSEWLADRRSPASLPIQLPPNAPPVDQVIVAYVHSGSLPIGATYLESYPAEREPALLRTLIFGDAAGALSTNARDLYKIISSKLDAEYEADEILQIGNFCLCRTELRLIAAAYLLANNPQL
jgi:hypothetical protein